MADQEFVPNQGVRRNHPLVYEIHTRAWLAELAGKYQRLITLSNIPDEEFAALARLGFTHIWMMGVWMVGREAVAHA